ncbi:pyruvate dehydrogenase (acetyl-transferring) E1 component subunit alpha [Georgenia wutianyii]|uniref:Pyruvate dehydrogenase (Acetyl-transferring) E1 component subunit alpha n=1 Tax=Georgenia wutianyii TaxID=2585135 RepID=A0ABX5VPY5_9MICO|nr:pyruvate dehydrogenase (acetyl-transferring) E1 component subunit alpha [Georgenia wutianyii]QDB80527.1 pyruvate dehydrogenase (acetyl-transferring) E1 component subunit alpha [Georgenia wutianyii]
MDTLTPRPQTSSTVDPDTLVQLLDPEGRRLDHSRYDAWVADLGPAELRGLYRDMVLARRFDAEATALQRQGELGLWPPSLGQEAAQVGSGRALRPRDFVFPSYREHAVAHTRGLDMRRLLRVFRGVEHGGWDPAAHNFHLYTFVIGSHTLHATGYAMGVQRDGDVGTGDPDRDRAVVVYFGDGATSQGDVHEAMVFAAVTKAPVVFVCQNNQWAISVPTSGQTTVPLARRGPGLGIPSVRVDGNDVLASYAVTAEALERARSGGGPTFIEAYTYRMGAHTTSDDPTRYRTSAEEDYWRERDPIARLRTYLTAQGHADEAFLAEVEAAAEELGESTREYCRALTPPPAETMFDHVYAAAHPQVEAERAWFTEYQASFAEGAR